MKSGILSTKIYYKPTNTFSFPLGSSYMSMHVHRSIAIGEMSRLLRNTVSPSLFRRYKNRLIRHFAKREYPKRILKELRDITHDERSLILYRRKDKVRMERALPFVTPYSRHKQVLNRIFRKRWRSIYDDHKFYTLLPNMPFTVFKNHKALKSLLSAKRRYLPDLDMGVKEAFKHTKFNHHRMRKWYVMYISD